MGILLLLSLYWHINVIFIENIFSHFYKISNYGQKETDNLASSILQQSYILLKKLKTVILCKHVKTFNNACDRDVSSIVAVPNCLS
jgi:hypothetical protein